MPDNNQFTRAMRWVYSTQKPVLFTLAFYLLVILAKNIAIKQLDSFEWYKTPAISFLQLVEWMALTIFILSLVSKIPYIRVPLITLGMSFALLIGVEATCLWLYEYDHRPKTDEELKEEEADKASPGWIAKLFAKKESAETLPPIPDVPESYISAAALGVDTLPPNFEQLKVAGEPAIRKTDLDWKAYQQGDPDLSFANKPNGHVELRTWSFGIANPVANYTMDSLGRRSSGNNITSARDKYALFLGCSVTFGVLVDDKQTMPSILERIETNYRTYNYGVSGYGTHHVLALLQGRNLKNEVREADGVAFYIYFPGHLNRALGDMDSYMSWNAESPFYYLDGDKIVRHGNFKTGRKLISKFYVLVAKSYIGKYFDLHLPGKLRTHHYKFGARMIEEVYKKYQEQFGNDKFYVVFLPGWGNDIKPYLEELNIKYLDYDRLLPYWQDKYQFAGDGHPRPLFYKILAEYLVKDVTKGNPVVTAPKLP